MKSKVFILLLLSLLIVPNVAIAAKKVNVAPVAHSAFVPPEKKIMVLIGQDRDTMANYIKGMNQVPAGFMVYTSIQEVDGLDAPSTDRGSGIHDAQYFVNKYPNTVLQIGLYMVGALDDVIAGKYDENIKKLGRWIKSTNRPVYLRIGYEFDLPQNHYNPEQYVKAFRYIVDRLRAIQVNNVAFVWHSYGFLGLGYDVFKWYPGDDYVDWFGVTFFNPYYKSDKERFAKFAKEHKKPLMLAEASPFELGKATDELRWQRWYKKVIEFAYLNDARMLCYINSDWETQPMFRGQGWDDARIEHNPYIKAHWREEMRQSRYIHSRPDLFKILAYK